MGFTARIAPSPSTAHHASSAAPVAPFSPQHPSTYLGAGAGPSVAAGGKQPDLSHLLDQCEPSDLASFGLIPELIGRLPITAALRSLTEQDLLRVLTEPKNALVKQYCELFSTSGVELRCVRYPRALLPSLSLARSALVSNRASCADCTLVRIAALRPRLSAPSPPSPCKSRPVRAGCAGSRRTSSSTACTRRRSRCVLFGPE